MSDKKDYYRFVTPFSTARYPKLDKQDTYEGKEVGYKCDMNLEGDVLAEIQKHEAAAIAQLAPGGKMKNGKKTFLRETDDGDFFLTAKSYNKVTLFGAKGKQKLPEDTVVGGGSTIRMKVSVTIGNGHLVAYINSIQVAKLVEGGADGFDDADDYVDDQAEDEGFDDGADLDI